MALLRREEPAQNSQPAPIKQLKPKQGEVIAILGQGSEFEGKLTFKGTVRIDGVFRGEIFSDSTLIIGEGAEVRAAIEVGTVIIHGNVRGDITATYLVELHNPAKVYGKLITPNLVIEQGVVFQGECQMENIGQMPKPSSVPAKEPIISKPEGEKVSAAAAPVDIGED